MILSGEILGCSLCEDIAFDSYNKLNKLKDVMGWYLECEDLEPYASMYEDIPYEEYIKIVEYAEAQLMEALK